MKKSFTLIEMLVTIAIITIITATSVAGLKGYKSRSYFNEAVSQVHGEVLKAQSLALAPSATGIDSYTLAFTGNAYTIVASNSPDSLDSGSINSNVSVSGDLILTFHKDGSADPYGTITISDNNDKFPDKHVEVTAAGSVELK